VEMVKTLNLVFLVGATAAIIAGTAISWHVQRTVPQQNYKVDNSNYIQSAEQYFNIAFVFALVFAWILELLGGSDAFKSSVPPVASALFFGLFFFVHVSGPTNWQELDDLRYAYNNRLLASSHTGVFYYSHKQVKLMLASGILNFGGIYLAALAVFGSFKFRVNLATFTFLGAVACGVVGVVILWNLKALSHLGFTTSDDDNNTAGGRNSYLLVSKNTRNAVFHQIAVPQIALLVMLGAAVLFSRVEGALCAALFVGLYGVWYLQWGFYIKFQLQNVVTDTDSNTDSQVDKAWAGSLFCWFSTWAALVSALFAFGSNIEE